MVILEKKDNWFNEYHEIPSLGIEGNRKLSERLIYYDQKDFKDASVIDFGCNMGQMSFQAVDWGASKVLGVEFDSSAIENALKINEKFKTKINFIVDDLDNPFFWKTIGKFDVTLFLSVIDTIELENRYGILAKACMKTKKVMYFEGHAVGNCKSNKYLKNIMDYTDFTQVEFRGLTPPGRPFFKCSRKVLTSEECVEKILASKYKKIAVIGKALAGKTSIRKLLQEKEINLTIVDDLYVDGNVEKKIEIEDVKKMGKLVLFDYRAIKYVEDMDVVFFVTPEENLIGQQREGMGHLRCPKGSLENLKEVYTVLFK